MYLLFTYCHHFKHSLPLPCQTASSTPEETIHQTAPCEKFLEQKQKNKGKEVENKVYFHVVFLLRFVSVSLSLCCFISRWHPKMFVFLQTQNIHTNTFFQPCILCCDVHQFEHVEVGMCWVRVEGWQGGVEWGWVQQDRRKESKFDLWPGFNVDPEETIYFDLPKDFQQNKQT